MKHVRLVLGKAGSPRKVTSTRHSSTAAVVTSLQRTSTSLCGRLPGQDEIFARRPMSVIRHRYERAMELAGEGEIEVHDWTKHGQLDVIYIHASPAWVCFRRRIFCASQPACMSGAKEHKQPRLQ